MCADFSNLKNEVKSLEAAGVDIFHMDFMDGSFVPNFAMGLQDFQFVRSATKKMVDVHLMIQEPSKYVEMFAEMGADIIYVHPEADQQVTRTIVLIHSKGKKAGIAINPGTSVSSIMELLPLVDYVMVMTVNPGFAGQEYLPFVDKKIDELTRLSQSLSFEVMVDGAISPKKITHLSKKGVKGFVLGTSALFGKETSYADTVKFLKKIS